MSDDVESLPGYRRTLRIVPGECAVLARLEDDLHCMAVRLGHDGGRVTSVDAEMARVPWTVCPGARAVLLRTFTGLPLGDVTSRRDKQANCTHLHDLAVLAAAHAGDAAPTEFRVFVSDPRMVRGASERSLLIWRDGAIAHRWTERDGTLSAPPDIAGLTLLTLRDWIAGLPAEAQKAARLLQWGALVAHGRQMSEEQRLAALGHRASCYTMQPERVGQAAIAGGIHDFSAGGRRPLEDLGEMLAFTTQDITGEA